MKNPRYEGFANDGGSYVFTAKTAEQDLMLPNVVKLNGIVGEVYQADKTRTDITATRGVFNNEKSLLDLYEEIASAPELYLDMQFEPGDIQLLSNHVVLHARTEYQDFAEPERKRHLLRLWLSLRPS